MKQTNKPFGTALKELMQERGWSIRELARRTQRETEWGAQSTIHVLLVGQATPTKEAIERVAHVFRISPEYFAEYRLAMERERLDPEVVGLEAALRHLKKRRG